MNDQDFAAIDCRTVRESALALQGRFAFTSHSNKGSNGYVFFGTEKVTGQAVAIKYYWGGPGRAHREPQLLASLKHPNLIDVLSAETVDDEWAFFVTPLCLQGDLDHKLETQPPSVHQAIEMCSDLLQGLIALHAKNLVHRDLKPGNIFVDAAGRAVIGDFGSVKHIPDGSITVNGSGHSILYRPPESFANNEYGFPGDVYQCGVVLYQLLGGRLPYDALHWLSPRERREHDSLDDPYERSALVDDVLKKKICSGKLIDRASLPAWIGAPLRRCLSTAVATTTAARYTRASELLTALHTARSRCLNWHRDPTGPRLALEDREIRIVTSKGRSHVEQRKQADWRRDGSYTGTESLGLIQQICKRYRGV